MQRASMDALRSTARRLCRRNGRVSRLSGRVHYAALLVLTFLATLMALINFPVRLSARVTSRVTLAPATAAPASVAPVVVTSETVAWTHKPEEEDSLPMELEEEEEEEQQQQEEGAVNEEDSERQEVQVLSKRPR